MKLDESLEGGFCFGLGPRFGGDLSPDQIWAFVLGLAIDLWLIYPPSQLAVLCLRCNFRAGSKDTGLLCGSFKAWGGEDTRVVTWQLYCRER